MCFQGPPVRKLLAKGQAGNNRLGAGSGGEEPEPGFLEEVSSRHGTGPAPVSCTSPELHHE